MKGNPWKMCSEEVCWRMSKCSAWLDLRGVWQTRVLCLVLDSISVVTFGLEWRRWGRWRSPVWGSQHIEKQQCRQSVQSSTFWFSQVWNCISAQPRKQWIIITVPRERETISWFQHCNICLFIIFSFPLNGMMIFRMDINLYWRTLETSHWHYKIIRKLLS